MFRKIMLIQILFSGLLFSQPPASTIDTVLVTPVFLKLIDNSDNIYRYTGRVTYTLAGWSNDRFDASLSIVNDQSGNEITITSTKGDAGEFNRGGTKNIHFRCRFDGPPSGTYKARVTVNAAKSDTAQFIENLISSLSNNEKQTIINSGSAGGVPAAEWEDGPYGIRGGYAYPCGNAMAATFDTVIAEQGGIYKGQDFRAINGGRNIMLGPTLNLVRDGRGGRSFESYGEDPYVLGKMAAADTRGAQKSGVMVTLKHYVCNNVERARGGYP